MITVVAGLVAGVLAASAGRFAMRLLAMAGGDSFEFQNFAFTLDGTVRIVLQVTIFGLPGAFMLLALRKWIPGTGNRKIVSYGLALVAFPGLLLLTDTEFASNPVNATFGRALFAACYFVYGAVVGWFIETLDRKVPLGSGSALADL